MRIGVIGASFARQAYLPAFAHVEGAEVIAVASARLASARAAAEAFGVVNAYDDWRQMLDRHQFDLVCIATPTIAHAPMTLAALEAGAHVLCEKPTALDAGQAKAMLDRARALGRCHMIDHELRFNPNRRRVKQLIESGAIGRVRHVAIVNVVAGWGDPASRPKDDWLSRADQGGGRLGANGSHQVDLLRWWLGEVAAVSGELRTLVPDRRDKATGEPWTATADDFCQFTLELASGAVASVLINGAARHALGNRVEIVGSDGTIRLDGDTESLQLGRANEPFQDITEPNPWAALPGIGPGVWNAGVVPLLQALCAAIGEGRQPAEGASFEDGWRNQRVLDAVRRSSAERLWVRVD